MNKVSELSDDLEAVSVVLGGLKRELRTHRRFISTLLHIFHGITDFRESYKVKYNLENIKFGKYYLYVSAHCNAGKIHLVLQCCSIHKNQGGLLQKIQSYQR